MLFHYVDATLNQTQDALLGILNLKKKHLLSLHRLETITCASPSPG